MHINMKSKSQDDKIYLCADMKKLHTPKSASNNCPTGQFIFDKTPFEHQNILAQLPGSLYNPSDNVLHLK